MGRGCFVLISAVAAFQYPGTERVRRKALSVMDLNDGSEEIGGRGPLPIEIQLRIAKERMKTSSGAEASTVSNVPRPLSVSSRGSEDAVVSE